MGDSIYIVMADRMSTHMIRALAGEVARGNMDSPSLKILLESGGWVMDAGQEAEFDILFSKIDDGTVDPVHLEDVFFLVEAKLYTVEDAKASLGV